LFIELTPADIAAGSVTITTSAPDGFGGSCDDVLTINFADFPQATDPFCILNCANGGIAPFFEDVNITICEGEPYTFITDDLEELIIPCTSDDGSSYVYGWRLLIDINGNGNFIPVTDWQILGIDPIFDLNFFIDEFGGIPPYFTPGNPINPIDPNTGLPWEMQIQGASFCFNADGSIDHYCTAQSTDDDFSVIDVTYLPTGDPLCPEMGEAGCIDNTACNYDPDATVDDGSCTYAEPDFDCDGNCLLTIDCAGECGGNAIEGTACTDANGEAGVYAADCTCIAGDCEEEIAGSISSPDPLCDLSGINIVEQALQ